MVWVLNPETNKKIEVEDEFDPKTSENLAIKKAVAKGYKETEQQYRVVNPETKEVMLVDDLKKSQAKGYIEKGEWDGRNDAIDKYKKGITKTDSAALGWFDGASQGFGDEVVAGVKAAGNKIATLGKSDFTKDYRTERDDIRANNKMAEEVNPWSYGLSKFGGNVVSGAAAGGAVKAIPAVANATAAGRAALGAGKIATGVELAAAGALQSGVSGFGEAEGDLTKQLSEAKDSAAIGAGLSLALPIARAGGKKVLEKTGGDKLIEKAGQVLKSPWESIKKRIAGSGDDVAEFLGKPQNVEAVRTAPIFADEKKASVNAMKKELPSLYINISKELDEVDDATKKVVNNMYGEFSVRADADTSPVDPDADTTASILRTVRSALKNPQKPGFSLSAESQSSLNQVKTAFRKEVNPGAKKKITVDPETGQEIVEVVPYTNGENLKNAVDFIKRLGAEAHRTDSDGKVLDELYSLRQFYYKLKDKIRTNEKGDFPEDALEAYKAADEVFSKNSRAREARNTLYVNNNNSTRPDANKIETALNKYEGHDSIEESINVSREIAGMEPKPIFTPVREVEGRMSDALAESAERNSQAIRYNNLSSPDSVGQRLERIPVVGPFIPGSTQSRIKLLNAIDSGVVNPTKKAISSFTRNEFIQKMAEKNPIKASWFKQLAADTQRPITRAVIQSIARHAKVPESEIERDLEELGLGIKP